MGLSDQGVCCWSGNDEQSHLSGHVHGAVGVISVTANVVPGLMRELMLGERNDELDRKLQPLFRWLFVEPNPIGVNTMLMMLGAAQPVFRLPYTHTSQEMRDEATKLLPAIGTEHMPLFGGQVRVLEDGEFKHVLNGDGDA